MFDRYLYDCKYESYWRDTYGTQEILAQYGAESIAELPREAYSPEDAAFLDFLGYKYAEYNATNLNNWRSPGREMRWSEFEKMISYFENNNKPLYITIGSCFSSHSVLAYGVEPDPVDPDVWYILVYDNNFPGGKICYGGNWYSSDNRIKVTKERTWYGGECAEWCYYPLPTVLGDYLYQSEAPESAERELEIHVLMAIDEDYNIIFK